MIVQATIEVGFPRWRVDEEVFETRGNTCGGHGVRNQRMSCQPGSKLCGPCVAVTSS